MLFMVAGIVLLLAMVMFTVDVASMQLVRTELRAASDAAAKAGAESLLRTQNQGKAVDAAVDFASQNSVGGKSFKIATKDVVVGTSTVQSDGSWIFVAGGPKPNAVRVNSAMTDGSASGAVSLMFAKAFGAGKFMPTKSSTASATAQEICLVLDRSSSMSWDLSGTDFSYPANGDYDRRPMSKSRWDALDKAVKMYLTEVQQTPVPARVALVTWASDTTGWPIPKEDLLGSLLKPVTTALASIISRLEAPLSYDFTLIASKMKQLGEHPLYGFTNMSAGIDMGVQTLTANSVLPYAQKTIVLMTDGEWNEGRNPQDAALDALDQGVRIHVVTFVEAADNADAKAVASITGGQYIHCQTEKELIDAFEKLARTLPVVLTD
ncbi:hypothetical protein AYO47_00555 [Planctomyces sp. SCGC AG-212-M04]|nr:hypothetical protein AYO47_00555 [Planctomyces sp. SCGC AG-212-M04]